MLPDLFFTINFSVSITASAITFLLGLVIIITVIAHPPCHTVKNLLLCNTAAATCVYSLFQIVLASYGFGAGVLHPPPACIFQAYFYTVVCVMVPVSYMVQSISCFFFAALYRYRFLLGWKIHCLLIAGNYLYAFLGSIVPIFRDRGLEFEPESRLCLATTKIWRASFYTVSIAYLIPMNVIIVLYATIVHRVRQSARRVTNFVIDRSTETSSTAAHTPTPNLQREMKVMKNVLILISILLFAGLPYLLMVIWQMSTAVSPPEPMYLLCLVNITVFFVLKMFVLFQMNKEVKSVVLQRLRRAWHILC